MTKDNVIILQKETKANTKEKAPEEILKEVKKDMGKVALIISIMAVMLMVVFYFSMKLTVGTMEKKITELYPVKKQVVVLDKTVGDLQSRMEKIEKLPEETRKMIYGDMLNEISQKAEYLSKHLNGANRDKLIRVQRMLKDLESSLK
ncbi:hypothetical protein JCM13304A_18620 [Desulfothermus okinawensis JCM 13304]